jgi:hypothetical protein
MSGPIVRKYGFPNFEKIFGDRPLKHGTEEEAKDREAPETPAGSRESKDATPPPQEPSSPAKRDH